MKITKLTELKGPEQFGTCAECGKVSTEDKDMCRIVFENNVDEKLTIKSSTALCKDCLRDMCDLIENYLDFEGRLPW